MPVASSKSIEDKFRKNTETSSLVFMMETELAFHQKLDLNKILNNY